MKKITIMKLTNLYKSLNDKPLHEQYDPGNEPLEIQYHEDQQLYYIDVEDIEAYVSGETVWATDPDRGGDDIEVNRENSDVSGVEEDELEDFMVSGDRSADDVDDDDRFSGMDDVLGADLEEGACTEQEIAEGTCGHNQTTSGKKLNTPGGTKGMPANRRTTIIKLGEHYKLNNILKK